MYPTSVFDRPKVDDFCKTQHELPVWYQDISHQICYNEAHYAQFAANHHGRMNGSLHRTPSHPDISGITIILRNRGEQSILWLGLLKISLVAISFKFLFIMSHHPGTT